MEAAAFVEGGIQDACDDACSICLEAFSDSDPSAVTSCKHEFHLQCILEWSIRNSTARRSLGYLSCGTGNPIDACWRCDSDWHNNRQRLADCGIGFGRNAIGGRDGKIYVVTDPGDDDPVNPRQGTLRHAVIQEEPLWIIFKRDMVITLLLLLS